MNKTAAIKKLNDTELELGIAGTAASWHQRYLECDCVYVGGLPDSLTEQDILGVLEQYGIVLHLHLVRDSHTNTSRGFAFARYADPRSCTLAIDNLNGFELQGRTLRLDHADDYQDKEETGMDTAPPGFYRHREESTGQVRTSEDLHTSPTELRAEKRREKAVLERLAQLRNRQRMGNDEKRSEETPDEIQPSRANAKLSSDHDRSADNQNEHAAKKKRKRIEKERRRQEKEQRRAERARKRRARAERQAEQQNGT